jgi:hypothetical protein
MCTTVLNGKSHTYWPASRPHADLLSILDILRGRLPMGAQSAVSNAAYIPPQKGLRGDPITITQLSLQLK